MDSDLAKSLRSVTISPLEGEEEEEEVHIEEVEEDEEEDEEDSVQLGFVEKPKNPRLLLSHLFPNKAGGLPAWLDPVNLPPDNSRLCGFCGDPLQFLLQIYASIDGKESTFHRTLYVFMCPSMACLLRDQHEQWRHKEGSPSRSVKVFRCQLARSNPYYSSEPPKLDGTDRPLCTGVPLCCWCGTWKGGKLCGSCKKTRYCSEKHQAMHWKSGHKSECYKLIASDSTIVNNGNGVQDLTVFKNGLNNATWPEYEIVIEEESGFEWEKSEGNSSSTGTSAIVTKYNKTDEALQSVMDQFEADADKKSWASFEERISRAPEQVLRYCRDATAKPLWPLCSGRPSKTEIPPCRYCKGPLCYEFQIMPQLLYYFGVKNDSNSLDWGTIAVFTCLASCESSISYKEEFAWVQIYPATSIRPGRLTM
ncbi:Programmed cell death protein 2 [Rhynchospora pubera]|uniref:Programmed cell death protein 2 n=1 Tax=Rhynchospora pubera TaxID=906938 RepID=A0AAV8D9H4_9POAL|nr:Programmed cell death protein 2 [Rhynchospora pubera]